MNEPLVSIIMPAYNAEKYIEKAIKSIIEQDYQNWELLVCDDKSVDSTDLIIRQYAELDERIKLHALEKNSGAAVARNTCIENAKGDFIAFLDSDDLWNNTKLKKQIQFMLFNNYDFTCTYYSQMSEDGTSKIKSITYKKEADYSELLKNCPGNSTVIYNSSKLGKFYISDLKKRNDYLMWLQVIKKSKKLYCLEESLMSYRIVNNSLSRKKSTLIKYHWHIYRKIEKLGFVYSLKILTYWLFKGIKEKIRIGEGSI